METIRKAGIVNAKGGYPMSPMMLHPRARVSSLRLVLAAVALFAFCLAAFSYAYSAPINGFFVRSLPADFARQERFFRSLSDSGASTVIMDLPLRGNGEPDGTALSNAVYLVHQAGLKIFIIMPTRVAPAALDKHPEWEDRMYNLAENSQEKSGKLDLFQKKAVEHIAGLGKTVAAYAVDGILLGEDFTYGMGEGLGKTAVSLMKDRLHMRLTARRIFVHVDRSGDSPVVTEYGKAFRPWTEAKRDRLIETYESIRSAARSVNPSITVGVPVPVQLPVAVPEDLLTQHAFDAAYYKRAGVDYYWTSLEHRGRNGDRKLSFREGVELLSRSAYAAISSVKDDERMILVLQATTTRGRPLSLTEIEEITGYVRHAGRTGIVYGVRPGAVPSAVLTKKMFR